MQFDLSKDEFELTSKLQQKIANAINAAPIKSIPFSQYMNMALYDSEYGYYNNLLYKFGTHGDFITAPLVSNLFAKCISAQCSELFQNGVPANILEIGAGNGQLMIDILTQLSNTSLNSIPLNNYYVLELSASLAKLQQDKLQADLPQFAHKVKWLSKLPDSFDGIILANEVLDAQPTELVKWQNEQIFERHVTLANSDCKDNALNFVYKDIQAQNEIKSIANTLPITEYLYSKDFKLHEQNNFVHSQQTAYVSEISLANRGFITTLSQLLHQGCILLIDYGYGANEYYSINRSSGTLRGFFRHHMLDDVLQYPGLIDVTANVDFTALANTAISNNLDFIGYTTQANFLINCGLLDILNNTTVNSTTDFVNINNKNDNKDNVKYLQLTNQINKLTSINEMGEIFKVIGFSKNTEFANWLGFKNRDLSHTL